MGIVKHHVEQSTQKVGVAPSTSRNESKVADRPRVHEDVRRLMDGNQLDAALKLAREGGGTAWLKNARGVCLMRMGKHQEALDLYRGLVLQSGTIWMRPESPTACKVNFATALLLAGHPAGCDGVLAEINREDHPAVIRLRLALKQWKSELSVWQRLLLAIGQEPSHPATLPFAPGELDLDGE